MGTVVGDTDRLAVHHERARRCEHGSPFIADVAQQVDTGSGQRAVVGAGYRVDQVDQAVAVPVGGAERFAPVAAAFDDAVIDETAVLKPHGTRRSQPQLAVRRAVLHVEGRLVLLPVLGDDIGEAVAVPVREGCPGAPEEWPVQPGIRLVGRRLVITQPSVLRATRFRVGVAVDLQETASAEQRLSRSALIAVPDDPVGLVGKHQVGKSVAVPVDEDRIGVPHVVPVVAVQHLIAQDADRFPAGIQVSGLIEHGRLRGSAVDQDARPAVAASDQQVPVTVAVPVGGVRPCLIAQRHRRRTRLGALPQPEDPLPAGVGQVLIEQHLGVVVGQDQQTGPFALIGDPELPRLERRRLHAQRLGRTESRGNATEIRAPYGAQMRRLALHRRDESDKVGTSVSVYVEEERVLNLQRGTIVTSHPIQPQVDGAGGLKRPTGRIGVRQQVRSGDHVQEAVAGQIHRPDRCPVRALPRYRARGPVARHAARFAPAAVEEEGDGVATLLRIDDVHPSVTVEVGEVHGHVDVAEELRLATGSRLVPKPYELGEFERVLRPVPRIHEYAVPRPPRPVRIVPRTHQVGPTVAGQVHEASRVGQRHRPQYVGVRVVPPQQVAHADQRNARLRQQGRPPLDGPEADAVVAARRVGHDEFEAPAVAVREVLAAGKGHSFPRFVEELQGIGVQHTRQAGRVDDRRKVDLRIHRHVGIRQLVADAQRHTVTRFIRGDRAAGRSRELTSACRSTGTDRHHRHAGTAAAGHEGEQQLGRSAGDPPHDREGREHEEAEQDQRSGDESYRVMTGHLALLPCPIVPWQRCVPHLTP